MTLSHITGRAAAATVGAALGFAAAGVLLVRAGLGGEQGWVFFSLAGTACLGVAGVVGSLPWRLTTTFEGNTLSLGWALGRRRIAWDGVKRVVIGPLGTGGDRDPVGVTLNLADGTEVLFATLGKWQPRDHPACAPLLDEATRRGIPVDDTLAPPEERRRREEVWRKARLKGWR